jgi:hypothetical protein
VTITEEADTTYSCANSYVVTRTFTAVDECNNSSTCTQTITIQDTTAPVLSCPADYTAECSDEHPLEAATATDNCGEVTITLVADTTYSCPNSYVVTRTFTAVDECENSSTCTQTITIQDTTPPVLSCPADYTAECSDEHPLEDATATDNCSEVTITLAADTAYSCPNSYVVTRTFTAVDACENSSTCTQTITIQDTTAPVITGDVEVMIACEDPIAGVAHATASDNCGEVTLTWTDSPVSGGCVLPVGQYVRVYTATDACGNSSSFEQILTLTDNTPPVISCPADFTIECDETIPYEMATATDNCSGAEVTVSEEIIPGSCPQSYTIVRTFTATDNCDNSSTCAQTITVQDTTPPVISCPADYTAECSDEHPLEAASATDNCGEVTITEVADTTYSCANSYVVTRTFTAVDECNNSSTCTQTITIQDTTAPVLSCPADYTAECSDEHPLEDATAEDNCGAVTIVVVADTTAGDCAGNYVVVRTFTATDECGNSSSCAQTITIEDTTPPVLSCPADYTAECSDELQLEDATATDNCGEVTITLATDTLETDCAQEYSVVRTFTATDDCGNSSTCTQTITVQDTTAPIITGAGGLMNGETVEVCCEAPDGTITIPAAVDVTFTDNCDTDATQTYTETCVGGNCPTETVDSWCDITTPEVMPDGETCDNYAPHSLRLFNFAGAEFYTTVEGRVANNSDGTKTYTMTVVASDNANAGWTVTNHYGVPMTWQEWIDQPGNQSYKSDCGIGDHTTWMYTTLTSGSAEGWGDYAGSSLSFTHQPASGYFGFQIGEGANNKNGNYGFSAWMYYSGTFDGASVAGSGDVFGDLDCCLPYDLEREYVMTDCAGNTTSFHYTVSMTGEGCSDEGDAGISDEEDAVLTVAKDLIKIESLQPNPTSGDAVLMLSTEEESITAQVVVLTMSGAEVLDVYNGPIAAGWNMQIDIPSTQLQSGMYQVQVRAKQFVTTKKLLVAN